MLYETDIFQCYTRPFEPGDRISFHTTGGEVRHATIKSVDSSTCLTVYENTTWGRVRALFATAKCEIAWFWNFHIVGGLYDAWYDAMHKDEE